MTTATDRDARAAPPILAVFAISATILPFWYFLDIEIRRTTIYATRRRRAGRYRHRCIAARLGISMHGRYQRAARPAMPAASRSAISGRHQPASRRYYDVFNAALHSRHLPSPRRQSLPRRFLAFTPASPPHRRVSGNIEYRQAAPSPRTPPWRSQKCK